MFLYTPKNCNSLLKQATINNTSLLFSDQTYPTRGEVREISHARRGASFRQHAVCDLMILTIACVPPERGGEKKLDYNDCFDSSQILCS